MFRPFSTVFYRNLLLALILLFIDLDNGITHSEAKWGSSPVISGVFPSQISWSANSEKLVFQNHDSSGFGVNSSTQNWIQYNTITGEIIYTHRWPLQPSLSPAEFQLFQPFSESGIETFIYESSDGRYVIYAREYQELANADVYHITLADRQTNEVAAAPEFLVDPFSGPENFDVMWSRGNTAFVIQTIAANGGDLRLVFWGTDYDLSLSDLNLQRIEPEINDESYFPIQVHDISNDGSSILMTAIEFNPAMPDNQQTMLVVWNAVNSALSKALELSNDEIIGAAFGANDDKVVFINQIGVIQHDLISGEQVILNSSYTSIKYEKAIFSPNGEWVALIDEQSSGLSNIYLEQLLSVSQ